MIQLLNDPFFDQSKSNIQDELSLLNSKYNNTAIKLLMSKGFQVYEINEQLKERAGPIYIEYLKLC